MGWETIRIHVISQAAILVIFRLVRRRHEACIVWHLAAGWLAFSAGIHMRVGAGLRNF